jgi:FixJ family two-component response regulator
MAKITYKICIVEDDLSVGKALRRLVESFGYEVYLYQTATNFIQDKQYEIADCVLLDVNLPDIDGLKLQEQLQQEDIPIPIVFLTGNGDVPMSVRAMQAGAIDFLLKPVSEEALLKAISSAISIRQERYNNEAFRVQASQKVNLLTQRELQVFRCVLTGAMNKQIATHLAIAEKTVKVHRGNAMRKLEAKSIVDLIAVADLADIDADQFLKR